MTDIASADTPVAIDRVDRARGEGDGVRLRLTGRWLRSDRSAEQDPLLVIQLQGRRHRFPASPPDGSRSLPAGAWEATFAVPSWAEPRREGQAAVWVGNAVVPIPLPGAGTAAPAPPRPLSAPAPHASAPQPPPFAVSPPLPFVASPPVAQPADLLDSSFDAGRAGPPAELLVKESVSALHLELEQRSAEAARLRGSLADAQSELDARRTTQASLEAAHRDLRGEIQELMDAVVVRRQEFEQRLSDLDRRQSAAASERDRLRSELESERRRTQEELYAERDRTRRELEAERARSSQQLSDLTAARDAEAGEAAALRDRLGAVSWAQQQRSDELAGLCEQVAIAQVSRDAAGSEVAALRSELERLGSELAVSREQLSAQGGDLGEAQRLLADARALTEQLRAQNSH